MELIQPLKAWLINLIIIMHIITNKLDLIPRGIICGTNLGDIKEFVHDLKNSRLFI